MALAEQQRKTRGELAAERGREGKALASLQVEKASVDGERKKVEADLGLVRYLATLVGADSEAVLRWFILAIALLLDPAAVYDLCIVDEASKATPTEILIPMVRSKRWIIVGDPKQLPPFFEELGDNLLSEFDDKEVKATMLDRFLDEHEGLPPGCRAELRNQYRMVKPIGDLVSECFYGKRLNSPLTTHGLKLGTVFPKPVTWFSTHMLTHRSERSEGQTFQNPAEVRIVRQLLQRLQFVARAQKRRVTVAVIAGYTAQVKVLGEMASQGVAEWPDLEVLCNSVDALWRRRASPSGRTSRCSATALTRFRAGRPTSASTRSCGRTRVGTSASSGSSPG